MREGAAGNLPDAAALETALLIDELVQGGREGDLLLVLITGGGSALLPFPRRPITLGEKAALIRGLSLAGAPIKELNAVRKRISELKGGRLALKATRCGFRVIGLIISDIVGDPLDLIASGPTVLNGDDPGLAKEIIERYKVPIPTSVSTVLSEECETQSPSQFEKVQNFIIGNNDVALNAMRRFAESEGFSALITSNRVEGEAWEVATEMINRVEATLERGLPLPRPLCLISGGEPVVNVSGGGVGGRNLELALAFAFETGLTIAPELRQDYEIWFMSAGTDGIDGPTDAAGAIVDISYFVGDVAAQQLDPLAYLDDNDSYTFFEKFNDGESLIRCGHTGTNVMDVHAITIRKRDDRDEIDRNRVGRVEIKFGGK